MRSNKSFSRSNNKIILTLGFLLTAIVLAISPQARLSPAVSAAGKSGNIGAGAPFQVVTTRQERNRKNTILPSVKYQHNVELTEISTALSPLDARLIENRRPSQIGIGRQVGLSSDSTGRLLKNPDGTSIRMFAITSPQALGIRAHFTGFDLPAGDEVYVYGSAPDSHVAGPFTRKGPFGDKEFWSDTVDGDSVIVEHYMKEGERGFTISQISHLFKSMSGAAGITPEALSCELDASCFGDPEKNSVGRIDFIDGSDAFVCTGTMIADSSRDGTPFFLTANHCVSNSTVARTVEVFWFYQTSACNSGMLSSNIARSTPIGSSLQATSGTFDSTLLTVTGSIPAGVVFANWDSNPRGVGTEIFDLHHPDGFTPPDLDSFLRKSSGGIVDTNTGCGDSGLRSGYLVNWSQGITEDGSSGSALWSIDFNGNHLIGVLSCGTAKPKCDVLNQALFGKFSDFFPSIQGLLAQGGGGGGPQVFRASFDDVDGLLTIKGSGFDGNARVQVNGRIVAPPAGFKVKGGGAKLKVFGSASDLNLSLGANAIIVIDAGGSSNTFVLNL
ncbi:MAG TPA: hypothetical protein VN345_02345 [Blastocatellia bacterium]|nr:hypothetical protein [Blastocatellia bacterium]